MENCSICLCKNGKIYRELGCGHRFHHKCLSLCLTKHCPLCRRPYENIVTRVRILSQADKIISKQFVNEMIPILNEFDIIKYNEAPQYINKRLIIINKVLKKIIEYKHIILNKIFGLDTFITTVKERIMFINNDIMSEDNNSKLTQQNIITYKKYSTRIIKMLAP